MEAESEFHVVVCDVDGRSLVKVDGALDAHTAPTLREALIALHGVGEHEIRIDLAAVTFIDSTGIGVLVDVVRVGGVITIVAASPTVQRLLELTGLTSLDNVHGAFASAPR